MKICLCTGSTSHKSHMLGAMCECECEGETDTLFLEDQEIVSRSLQAVMLRFQYCSELQEVRADHRKMRESLPIYWPRSSQVSTEDAGKEALLKEHQLILFPGNTRHRGSHNLLRITLLRITHGRTGQSRHHDESVGLPVCVLYQKSCLQGSCKISLADGEMFCRAA